jgi:hypothetical protein
MHKPRQINGQWYIFGENQPFVPGVLNFDPESGLTLDAQRHRNPSLLQAFTTAGLEIHGTIRALDDYGSPLSLFGCALSSRSSSAGMDTFKILPLHAFIGAHYQQFSNVVFNTVRANYSLLDFWLLRSSLTRDVSEAGYSRYSQHPLPDIVAALQNDVYLTITTSLRSENRAFPPSVTLTQNHSVQFEFPCPILCTEISNDYIYVFGRLLSFLTGFEVFVDSIRFPRNRYQFMEVEWFHAARGISTAKREHIREPLVSYEEIGSELPALITRWFVYQAEMEAITNLYFTAISNLDIPGSTRFLLLAQALEAYHGRSSRFEGEVQSSDVFRQRRNTLIAAFPENERSWLQEKLHHANQKTLAQRLEELIADQRASVTQFITDTNLFANTIRWTRNYNTHFSEDEEDRIERGAGRIAQGADLLLYAEQMRAILELLFIRDLGLPNTAIDRVIQRVAGMHVVSA